MKLARRRLALLVLPAMLVGCMALEPRSVSFSESELQRLVERAFPLERRVLDVLEVSITSPKLGLLPERKRLTTELDISARNRLFGGQWQGRLALESGLRYEPSDQSLRLAQVRVLQFKLNGEGSARAQAERVATLLAERVLEGFSVYRLPQDKAAILQRAGMTPGEVLIGARGVEITLLPAAR
jgi:Protein of unknown function (DUF1439)